MKVVHVSLTPLAGSPLRIVNALRKHCEIDARWVNWDDAAYGSRVYPGDIDFQRAPEAAIDAIKSADLLHLHHWFDLESNPFRLNLQALGTPLLRQFHTHPMTLARGDRLLAERMVNDPLPQIVIAQFHARYYPRAWPVPNVVSDEWPERAAQIPHRMRSRTISFFPTTPSSARESRWDTKGRPETEAVLADVLPRHVGWRADVADALPWSECANRRLASRVTIDEVVTGSYHLASLDGLSMGCATLAHLDPTTIGLLHELTGTSQFPWINCSLESLSRVLEELLADEALVEEIGSQSVAWIREYWSERDTAFRYFDIYRRILSGGFSHRKSAATPRHFLDVRMPEIERDLPGASFLGEATISSVEPTE